MPTAAAANIRKAAVDGAEHADSSLAAMKTGDIAALIAAIRSGNPPKPATKTKAIEPFWQAAESLPKEPEVPESQGGRPGCEEGRPWFRSGSPDGSAQGQEVRDPDRRSRAGRKVQAMNPLARRLAEEIRNAGRSLGMAECSPIVCAFSKTKQPDKLVAWHFRKVFRPAGILTGSRNGRKV
ncbi:MAG: hypothetical protein ACR2I2_14300 [Bryobacteraceae bacterium]